MLKRIVLKNFKSFKNLELEIPEGFTAIVGPNGSGKSNIVDAILFVLGRSSAKKLRADRFKNLITYHNGRRADYAEVAIFLKNDKIKDLPEEFGILRRIKKSGETDYYLILEDKRKKLTKTEIIDIFRKMNLLNNNVISQGDLAKIINISPIERRKIIDEISGIAEFDEKKKKAEEELKKARELIEMIDIRISEVKNQLNRLKKEKEDAEKYLKLKDLLNRARYTLYLKKVEYLREVINNINNNITHLKEKKEKLNKDIKIIEEEISKKNNELKNILSKLEDKEVISLYKEIKELELEIENDKKLLSKLKDEAKNINKDIIKKNEELKDTIKKLEEYKEIIKNKEKILEDINKKLYDLTKLRDDLINKIKDINEEINSLKEKENILNRKINEKQNLLYSYKENLSQIELKINQLNYELKRNIETIKKLKDEIDNIKEYDTKELYLKLENIKVEIEFKKKQIKELEEKEKEIREKLNKLYVEYTKEETKIKALKELEDIHLDRAIKEVLKLPGVIDVVGNLGKTKKEYKLAIEVAGGNRLNYVVTEDIDSAINAINYLKKHKLGRVTFLPLDKVKGRKAKNIYEDGVIGNAIDLVDFDEKYRNIFEFVFGDTVIVENIEIAKELSKKYNVRFVTLEGEVIESSGALIGGTFKSRAKIMIDVDENKIKSIANKIKELDKELEKIKNELSNNNKSLKELLAKKIELENKLEFIKKENLRLEKLKETNKKKINELNFINKELNLKLENLNKERNDLVEKIKELEDEIKTLVKERDEILAQLKQYENREEFIKLKDIENEINELSIKKNTILNEINKYKTLVDEILNQKIEELTLKIEELNKKLFSINENIKIYEENINKNLEILKEKKDKYEKISKDLKELNNKKIQIESEISSLKSKKSDLWNEINKIENEITKLLLDKTKFETKLEEEERNLYLCEIKEVDKELLQKPIKDIELTIYKIEEEIRQLEPVNMKAIEDYNFIYERFNELIKKREIYEIDEKKYLEMLREIEKKKKEVFLDTFNKIAKNFEEVYKQIGGIGKLRLENKNNPFEGGLLIDASPKGKKLISLESMSGGEKALTSLAFLFAIQKLNPSLFYVLDEVDAPLDVKNVSLIAEMIKNQSKQSQFIVISHREQMINKADTVYGVYMENGLSKVVGIKL
ncbi:chromosome segregation protein SMC [Methanocaldococcus indicus]|uniref:chromosome segregation protein SMC n=1 Tax=Methanocaldococcus indicus TaxID=213231 RepID=UPI003C6D3C28